MLAAMVARTSKSATILLGKAVAAVKLPPIRSSTVQTPANSLIPTRSLSHLFTPPQNGFFYPHSWAQSAAVSKFNGVRYCSSRSAKVGDGSNMSETRNIWDHKRRLLAAKYELRRKLHNVLCMDPNLPADLREKHRIKLSRLPRNSSFTRIRNRCIVSGRARAVYKRFQMSRIVFRDLASNGALMGVKKASW